MKITLKSVYTIFYIKYTINKVFMCNCSKNKKLQPVQIKAAVPEQNQVQQQPQPNAQPQIVSQNKVVNKRSMYRNGN